MNMNVVKEARTWIGVKWCHQGRSREGIDCAGLVIRVAQDLGCTDFDTADYARQATDETMLELCREHLTSVDRSDLQPGDVLVMAFENQRHMAIVGDYPYPGELSIIHAYALAPRKVVEVRLDSTWMARVIGTFRFPEAV